MYCKLTLYDFHVKPTLKECYHRHHIWYDQRPSKMEKISSFDTLKTSKKLREESFVCDNKTSLVEFSYNIDQIKSSIKELPFI